MTKLTIAVVEDEPIISADLGDRLTDLGYRVSGNYSSGEKALEQFKKSVPDLILMDVKLEGALDGVDTALAIRRFSQVPVIFLTSNSDEVTYRRARAARPSAFISKPFRGRDLAHAIDLALTAKTPPSAAVTEQEPIFPEGESALLLHDRLFLKVKDRLVRIMLHDILWIEADDYYCKVITDEREFLVTKTLKKLSGLLPPDAPFVRCHRSYLVNLQRITEIGEIFVFVGSHKIPVSRSKRSELMTRVGNL
ncbi:LytTR family two component transcriptional regulator [Neolewinella xylanilytica]|uniref:LytTR family two component transcriptional regulator n=1 Tax=Neolewinella xylanilytica TaxID=1514080 RepID=A0A2S6I2I5_9BACT|nr:response regulator [Neolewinella xylanilytica]PPK85387.1 LytTR family two component transcriptional regulator [Neolewinella xylanilytica]